VLLVETTISELVEYMDLWNKEYALNMVFRGRHGKHTAWTVGNVLVTGIEIAPGHVLCEFDNFDLQGADNVARRAFQRTVELLRESFPVGDTPSASRAYGIMDRQIERGLRVIPAVFADTPLDGETEADFKAHIREKNPDITEEELSGSWQSFCHLVEQQRIKREEQEKRRGMTAEDAVSAWSRKVAGVELTRRLKVFLCHASGDKPAVRELYHRLRGAGFDPWLDEEKLLPGQDWQLEIPQAVRSSDAVVICLSRRAVTKAGYVQKEIQHALDVADEQPERAIFLIPLRLEECEVPQRLRRWQRVDLFHERGCERLLSALRARAKSLGLPTHTFEPETVLIPAGEFIMGSDPRKDKDTSDNEQLQHTLYLPDYYLARTPVTNAQYAVFVQATGYEQPGHWKGGKPPAGKEDHPGVYVSWDDAVAYCRWLSEATGRPYRLPSEAEWEKAARGTDGRIYPWGNKWDARRCNGKEGGKGDTTPIGAYPQGASPYGLLDMAGNVWEWTRSLWGKDWRKPDFGYPYNPEDGRENPDASRDARRVLRGGAFDNLGRDIRCAYRISNHPHKKGNVIGFRVAACPDL